MILTLPDFIKEKRKQLKLTKPELAERAGVRASLCPGTRAGKTIVSSPNVATIKNSAFV